MNGNDAPVLDRDHLIAAYQGYGRPAEQWLVGGEFERHLLRPDGMPVPYFGDHGVRWILERMTDLGWEPEFEGDNPIALRRDGAWITLEPGGQFELSGAPHATVHAVLSEARGFVQELSVAIGDAPVTPVALGYTPFARMADIPWVPKGRYAIMRAHLARTGELAHDMMKGTAALQASFDFSDEADCARKVELAARLAPLTTAMFANSPIRHGAPAGFMSFRGHVWTRTDPARTGTPLATEGFTFARWVDYLLDVPMMFTRIQGRWADAGGRSFRSWMTDGIDGVFPTEADWDLHLTSVFPEVRVKRTIEVRGADCVPLPLAGAFVALFKGLFYCARATDEALALSQAFTAVGTREERFAVACRDGLQGTVGDRTLAAWAESLLDVAKAGIVRCAPEDVRFLTPLIRQIETGRSPAADVLDAFMAAPTPATIIERASYRPDDTGA